MKANEILSVMNEGNEIVTNIEKQLFEVVKVPLSPDFGRYIELANKEAEKIANTLKQPVVYPIIEPVTFGKTDVFGIYKSKGGNALSGNKGIGKDFTPMQPKEFLTNIISTVQEFGANLDISTLKFKNFLDGSRIEFSIKMHPISFKNNKGLKDVTNLELIFTTGYDGTKSNTIALYTERLVCTNGMVRSSLEGTLKGKNTINGKAKILSYAKEVANVINGATELEKHFIELDKKVLTKEQIETFKFELLGYNYATLKAKDEIDRKECQKANKEFKSKLTASYKILENLESGINTEFKRTGQTAFGLLQGVTFYTNHIANKNNKRSKMTDAESIRFGSGYKMNNKAQDLIFAMV